MEEKVSFFHSDTATVRDKKSKVKDDVLAESVRRHPDKNTKNGDKDSTYSDDHLTYESLDLTSKPKVSGVRNLIALVSEDSGVSSAEDSGQGSDDSTPKSKIKLNRSERNNRSTRSLQRMNEKQLSVKEKGKKSSIKKSEKQSSSEPQYTVRERASKGLALIAKKLGISSKQSDAEKERRKEENRKSPIKINEDHSRPAKEHTTLDLGGGPELGSSSEECDQTNSNTSLTRHGSKRVAPNENKVSDDTNPFDNDMKKKCDEELPRLKWIETFQIVHSDKKWEKPRLEIVCKLGKVPHTEDIVNLFGEEILQLITYKEASKADWFERTILDENFKLKKIFVDGLSRLEWVESFKVIAANEECDKRRIKIVLNIDKVPCIDDILELFGEEILPFIDYEKCSKHEWFKANILGKNSGGEKNYKTQLAKLSWVKDFNIGIAKEPEKSWQIYITCAQNQVPSMVELKKLFGVNIALFVDFIKESREEDLAPPCLLQGPRPGDKIRVVEDQQPKGTVGILCSDQICVEVEDGLSLKGTVRIQVNTKHYATTCYHVCFKKKLPKDAEEAHKLLKNDCANHNSRGCQGATCVYTMTDDEENQLRQLGQFCRGLYDDDHDIAFVEMKSELDCAEAVDFVARNQIETELADIEQVEDIFFEMNGRVPVEKIGSVTGVTRGELINIDAAPPLGSPGKAPCYKIECEKKKETKNIKREGNDDDNDKKQEFAKEGDSGSLVYLLYKKRRIPFAYVYSKNANVFCRNLLHSITKLINDIRPCLNPHQEVNNQI